MDIIEIRSQWAYSDIEWRWWCTLCDRGGQWQFQSPEAARHLGLRHLKAKHPTVTERI